VRIYGDEKKGKDDRHGHHHHHHRSRKHKHRLYDRCRTCEPREPREPRVIVVQRLQGPSDDETCPSYEDPNCGGWDGREGGTTIRGGGSEESSGTSGHLEEGGWEEGGSGGTGSGGTESGGSQSGGTEPSGGQEGHAPQPNIERFKSLGNVFSTLHSFTNKKAIRIRSETDDIAATSMLAEALSGCGVMANANKYGLSFLKEDPVITSGKTRQVKNRVKNQGLSEAILLISWVYAFAADEMLPTLTGFHLVDTFKISALFETSGAIAALWVSESDKSVAFLAFRGTVGAYEWTIDISYSQCDYSFSNIATEPQQPMNYPFQLPDQPARVHCGYLNAYNNIRAHVRSAIDGLDTPVDTLHVIGHSLGGALCILAALDLCGLSKLSGGLAHPKKALVTTFGAPRLGNHTFAATVDATIRAGHTSLSSIDQIRADSDVVPNLPLPVMLSIFSPILYQHTGRAIYFKCPQPSLAKSHSLVTYMGYAKGNCSPE